VQPLGSSKHFMEHEGSLPSSQELSTCTYPEPDQFSSQHSLLSLNLPIFVGLMMEAIRSSETSLLTRVIRRNILEDGILHSS
jgi:hypothetical protein